MQFGRLPARRLETGTDAHFSITGIAAYARYKTDAAGYVDPDLEMVYGETPEQEAANMLRISSFR